jgi:hypothetical protein
MFLVSLDRSHVVYMYNFSIFASWRGLVHWLVCAIKRSAATFVAPYSELRSYENAKNNKQELLGAATHLTSIEWHQKAYINKFRETIPLNNS